MIISTPVMGAAGCSARGCHGGAATVDERRLLDAKWENAYTVWARHDKHTQAYQALQGELAAEMIAKLRGRQPGSDWHDATAEPRCLACHVTPALANAPSPLHAEGVSCDACHTAPGGKTSDWYEPHKRKEPAPGMRDLKTADRRAAVCVECHVGAPAAGSIPAREVTHDLVAAGHPRLGFEFVTYCSLLPPHWREKGSLGPQAWHLGQIMTVKAGEALIAARPKNAGQELADWHCFVCHHDLAPAGAANRPRYNSLQNVGRPSDPLAQVTRAGAADGNDPEAGRKLIAALRLPERYAAGELDHMTWDDAAQTYYALRAAKRPEITADLDRLAALLRLPRAPAVVNSPVGYDPKAVAKLLAEIAEKGMK